MRIKKEKIKFSVKKYFQTLGIAILVIAIFGAVVFSISRINSGQGLSPIGNDGKINVLLLGVDVEGLRTDAIMVVSYDTAQNKVNLLSIPRDTRMYIGSTYQKINSAHAIGGMTGKIAGANGTIEAVTRLTGIPINYYVEFSFKAIDNFMEILGPVTFDVPDVEGNGKGMNYDDPVQNLHIHLKPGIQQLSGNQMQQLLRYRKSNADPKTGVTKGYIDGDRGRVDMQQQFIKALVDQKLKPSLILKIPQIFSQMTKDIKTNLTIGDVTKYAKHLQGLTSESITSHQLPGEDNSKDYGGSYWICDLEATKTLVQNVFGYDTSKITIDSPNGVSKKPVKTSSPTKSTPKPKSEPTINPTPNTPTPTQEQATEKPQPTNAPQVTEKPTISTKPLDSTDKTEKSNIIELE